MLRVKSSPCSSSSQPGIPGVILCFSTGCYAVPTSPRPQTFVHAITSDRLFGFLLFLAGLMALTYWFWSIFVETWTLNFQGQMWNWLYLSQKWSDTYETKLNSRPEMWPSSLKSFLIFLIIYYKSKHIDWTQGLKYDQCLTLAMTLTLDFQGRILNSCISGMAELIGVKWKASK